MPDELGPPASRSARWSWWLSAALFFAVGSAYALSTPLIGVPDEAAHAIRAVAVVHGQLGSKYHDVSIPGGFTDPITNVRVPQGYAALGHTLDCLIDHVDHPASCGRPIGVAGPTVAAGTYVGTYPPTYYALVGWPSWLMGPRKALYVMRFLSVAMVAALLASAVRSLVEVGESRGGSRAWATSGVALAATPIAMFVSGGVNPAGLEIAAACCLWATALAALDSRGPVANRMLVRLGVAGVVLALTRPLSPVLALGVLVAVAIAAFQRSATPWRDHRLMVAIALIVVAIVGAEIMALLVGSSTAVITSPPGASEGRGWYLRESAGRTLAYLSQAIGHLGWLDIPISRAVTAAWAIAVIGLVAWAAWRGTVRQRLALAATAAAVLALPILAETVSGPTVGLAWQGRYVLPLAVGLPVLAAWILIRQPARSPARAGAAWAGVAIAAVVSGGQVAALVRLLDRYAVGLPSSTLAVFSAVGGQGPLGWKATAWVVVIVGLVTFGGLTWFALTEGSPTLDVLAGTPADEATPAFGRCDGRPGKRPGGVVTMAVGEIPEGAP